MAGVTAAALAAAATALALPAHPAGAPPTTAAPPLVITLATSSAKAIPTAQATSRAPAASKVPAVSKAKAMSGSPQQIAKTMLTSFGWPSSQFSCLQPLWAHESGWSVTAANAGTGAYGIPQAAPGSKMASAGPDWQTSAATQIRWGLQYIKGLYGSPCGAWTHEQATGWY